MSAQMIGGIAGIIISIVGAIGTAIIGAINHCFSVVDPVDLALQPLHVVLIVFIIVLASSFAVVIRAVWTTGIKTADRLSASVDGMRDAINDLKELHEGRMVKYDEIGLHAIQSATLGAPSQIIRQPQ